MGKQRHIRTWEDVEKLCVELGYVVTHKGTKHKRVTRKDGSFVTVIPSSGSDWRGAMNKASQLRRKHREDMEGRGQDG
jgi:hypothetical protein